MVGLIYYIGYGLLCQISNGTDSSQLHFFVDGFGLRVECSAEYIGETDYIVYLVGVVRTSGRHQYIRAGCHCIFVRNFGSGVGEGEYNRMVGHAAHHVLCQYVSFGQAEEYVCTLNGFFQCVHIPAVGGKEFFVFGQVGAVTGDDAFTVEHKNIFFACAEGYI